MKSDMLGSEVITLKNAGGAIVTNCIFGAYALGEITDIRKALKDHLEIKQLYHTDPVNHKFYGKQYQIREKLIRQDMREVFHTLKMLQES